MNFRLSAYSVQDIGQRMNQQDCFFPPFQDPCEFNEFGRSMVYYDAVPHDDYRLFVLCDGMGGHDSGEVASQTVTYGMCQSLLRSTTFEGEFDDELIKVAVKDAWTALKEKGKTMDADMGTTMTVVKFHADGATVGHVGDSRVYQFRPATEKEPACIMFQTEDHSVRNDLLREGKTEEANSLAVNKGNKLSRAFITQQDTAPEVEINHITDIQKGDIFLMCSDGIFEQMDNDDLCSFLTDPNLPQSQCSQRLLQKCKDNHDNHTAIIIYVDDIINHSLSYWSNIDLQPGTVLRSPNYAYHIEKVLGKGVYGLCYLANTFVTVPGPLGTIRTEVKMAVKEFLMEENMGRRGNDLVITKDEENVKRFRDKFRQEAQKLALLSNPSIVRVLEVFEANNTIYFSMEYIPDGNLNDYVGTRGGLDEKEAIMWIRQIGSALSYVHANNMLHLDIKPINVMRMGDHTIKLIDFGLALDYNEGEEAEKSTKMGFGTAGFAPPEQIDENSDHELSPAIDVYSLGATYYKLLTSFTPNDATDLVKNGLNLQPLEAKRVSKKSVDAILAAMKADPKERLQTVDEFLDMLPNPDDMNDFVASEEKKEFPWKIILFAIAVIVIIILARLLAK